MSDPHYLFTWDKLGDIKAGRQDLGEEVPVLVYRMLEYSLNHVLHEEFGEDVTNELFRKAGHLAGTEYAKNQLPLDADMNQFLFALQKSMREHRIGILRMEEMQEESGEFVLTVAQDLDCSGLPPTNEVVCNFDEGFIAGIMEVYTGIPYCVREIDCWASGARACRFKGMPESGENRHSGEKTVKEI